MLAYHKRLELERLLLQVTTKMTDSLVEAIVDLVGPKYLGNESYPPTMLLRIGQISQVFASASDVPPSQSLSQLVGTVKVVWLDRMSSSTQIVPISFPAFSNPIISTVQGRDSQGNVTQASVGSSYGITFVPSVGDLVICGFRDDTSPVALGFVPHNMYNQLKPAGTAAKDPSFGTFRQLVQGEIDVKGQQQQEVYLDRAGTLQLIVMQQPLAVGSPPIDKTKIPTAELARISLGVSYTDTTFSNPILSPYGKQVICGITLANGSRIQIDSQGNVDMQASGSMHLGAPQNVDVGAGNRFSMGALQSIFATVNGMTLGATSVNVNNGTNGAARLNDSTLSNATTDSAFWTWLTTTLPLLYDAHVHTSAAPGNPTSPPTIPLTGMPSQQVGEISSASGSVKIGN